MLTLTNPELINLKPKTLNYFKLCFFNLLTYFKTSLIVIELIILILKIVMERVAKRFLLHNSREREDVKESDFDELKQDMQMVRYELVSDVNTFAKNILNYTAMLHRGISLLGEHFFQKDSNCETSDRYKLFQEHTRNFHNELIDDVSLNGGGSGESANKSIKLSTKSLNESAKLEE